MLLLFFRIKENKLSVKKVLEKGKKFDSNKGKNNLNRRTAR